MFSMLVGIVVNAVKVAINVALEAFSKAIVNGVLMTNFERRR